MVKFVDANIFGIKRDIERCHRRRRIALKGRAAQSTVVPEEVRPKQRYNRTVEKSSWREEAQEYIS